MRRTAIGAAIVGMATLLVAGMTPTAAARCDRIGTCFQTEEPVQTFYDCTYDATFEGASIEVECYVDSETTPHAAILLADHQEPARFAPNAGFGIRIRVTRHENHTNPNNFTFHFQRDTPALSWSGNETFSGTLAPGTPDEQEFMARAQVKASAPTGRTTLRFVYWDDTFPGVHQASLGLEVVNNERRGPTPGPGLVAVLAIVVLVGAARRGLRRA